jgi:hypothetical protein
LDIGQQRSVALALARALGRRYRVRGRSAATYVVSQASRSDLDHALEVASSALSGGADRHEVHRALATAAQIEASAGAVTGPASEVRHHLGTTLEIALADEDVSVDALVGAVMTEVTAIGRTYLALHTKENAASDRALELSRNELAHLMDGLHGKFMLFQEPDALGLAPALVLDEPERERWGLIRTYKHPYIFVAAIIALVAAFAISTYFAVVVEFRVLPHIVRIHH